MVSEGEQAPDFELTSAAGDLVRLSDFRGRPVVLYFYPRDDTSGCTAEACAFRDAYDRFRERGAVVVGVSPDTAESHVRFKEKYALPFELLADPEHRAAEAYGAWVEKTRYGRKSMGIQRSTFVIDEDGTIKRVFPKVKPDEHPNDVLDALSN